MSDILEKRPLAANKKLEIEGYLFKNCKTGDFNPWRTLLEPHFIIPESLVAFCSVVFWPKANKQTNKQTNELNYINHTPRDLSDFDGE